MAQGEKLISAQVKIKAWEFWHLLYSLISLCYIPANDQFSLSISMRKKLNINYIQVKVKTQFSIYAIFGIN